MKKKYNLTMIYFILFSMIVVISIIFLKDKDSKISIETLSVNNKKYVYPLGNVIGIKASTDGILVLGYEEDNIDYIGGLNIGDNIIEVDGHKINNSQDVTNILNKIKKEEIEVTFERDGTYKKSMIKTKKENNTYKLGLWVRDKVSGIGTMTFYDPSTEKFKAIGHSITDLDTDELIKIKQGDIYNPINLDIVKGTNDKVGNIKWNFNNDKNIGSFYDNSNFGIIGHLENKKKKNVQLIEVGSYKDVKIGDAIIIFEDKNRNVTSYDIKISDISYKDKSNRDMVIEVVDNNLIEYTGGIIQGMSGVPIIQNNKIIGSITHVLKNNPKKGYGIFIDKMIE